MIGRQDDLDLERDPPPDIVVEIERTSASHTTHKRLFSETPSRRYRMPRTVVERLNAEVSRVLQLKETSEQLQNDGVKAE